MEQVLPGRKTTCFLYFQRLVGDSVLTDVPSTSEFMQHIHLCFTMTGARTNDVASFIGGEIEGQKVREKKAKQEKVERETVAWTIHCLLREL